MNWPPEYWIGNVLLLFAVYYTVTSYIDRRTSKVESVSFRVNSVEQALENALSDLCVNADECVELRKRVNYLEQKVDEYSAAMEVLATRVTTKNPEKAPERVSKVREESSIDAQSDVPSETLEPMHFGVLGMPENGSVLQLPQAQSQSQQGGLEGILKTQQLQHRPPHQYTAFPKDAGNKPNSTQSDLAMSMILDKSTSFRSKMESRKDSVMSAFNNFSGRKKGHRKVRFGGHSTVSFDDGASESSFKRMPRDSRHSKDSSH